jgi:polyhydroxybutyrate depolymerase
MLDDAIQWLPVDSSRICFAGMSNGAHMAYRYAAARPERLAAIACVAGPMAAPFPGSTNMPLLHVHGTNDEFAAYDGGRGPKSLFGDDLPSVPDTIAAWVRANGLDPAPRIETIPHRAGDGTTIEKRTFGPGANGVEVILYTVVNGGHTWPGQPPLPLALGKSSANMNANDVIWEFFERHRRKP